MNKSAKFLIAENPLVDDGRGGSVRNIQKKIIYGDNRKGWHFNNTVFEC